MKPTKAQVNIVDDALQAIMQTETWMEMSESDPCIAHSQKLLDSLLKDLDKAKRNAITDAILSVINDHEQVAVLYGMQVVFSMMDVSRNHKALSRRMLHRQMQCEGGDHQ